MAVSGANWVSQFPTSISTSDLHPGFRNQVDRFINALESAGAAVDISATLRPPRRVYLMHWSWRIAREGFDTRQVPSMHGVNVQWAHTDSQGNYLATRSVRAASDMVAAYGIVFRPALSSRHTEGLAIDMAIRWSDTLRITDAAGTVVAIENSPRNGGNSALHTVGVSYGVKKLLSDPPHWSEDGH